MLYKKEQCESSSAVELHLAKVDVAGSSPVFRLSEAARTLPRWMSRVQVPSFAYPKRLVGESLFFNTKERFK